VVYGCARGIPFETLSQIHVVPERKIGTDKYMLNDRTLLKTSGQGEDRLHLMIVHYPLAELFPLFFDISVMLQI
jgi:hypothetical protein